MDMIAMRYKRDIACIVVLSMVASASIAYGQGIETRDMEKVGLKFYLADQAERLDCYFTFEATLNTLEKVPPFETSYPFETTRITPNGQIATVDELITTLAELKDLVVLRNTSNPRVIHLMERALFEAQGYPLNEKADIAYSGVLAGLPSKLGERLQGIGPIRGGFQEDLFTDYVTQVRFEAKNKAGRDILTDCVPLNAYGRFLWRARTSKRDGKLETEVQYYGPKTRARTSQD
jgi:hypothetical protein